MTTGCADASSNNVIASSSSSNAVDVIFVELLRLLTIARINYTLLSENLNVVHKRKNLQQMKGKVPKKAIGERGAAQYRGRLRA